MWNKKLKYIGFIVLSVTLLSGVTNANLIQNGSFENPATAAGQSRDSELGLLWFSGGTGWGDEDIDGWNRTERIWHVTDDGTGLMPDGSYAEVLDASFEHGGIDVLSQGGLQLTAGMPYELSFYTWGENGNPRIDVDLSGPEDISLLDDYETDEEDGLVELVAVRFSPTVSGAYTIEFRGDRYEGANVHSHAWIDDVRLVIKLPIANEPSPGHQLDDIPHDVVLGWRAGGPDIVSHDVYFGTTFEDVNNASATNPMEVFLSQGQDVNTYDVGALEFGQTYYWRIDEINAAPDNTLFKGEIWNFTTEPYSIQIAGSEINVTASSFSNSFSLPQKTLDGSGMGEGDTHDIATETMWFTSMGDATPWIQYEFQDVKKLDIMKVWNSNSTAEGFLGYGVHGVLIEYSKDGQVWETLEDANEFSRAPGLPTYNQYDEIPFGGVAAKMVRLNIQSNFGGFLESYSLSEVQFKAIPTEARSPVPGSGAVDVLPNDVLAWRAGREAVQSTVYVSTDPNEVADGGAASATSNTNSISLSAFDIRIGKTYYWRVDEVNEAEAESLWASPVWSFSTVTAVIVEDFESYGNDSPDRPFQTWLDGFGYSADEFFPTGYGGNETGAGIGHDIWSVASPHYNGNIMETTNSVQGSSKSMPFYYNNSGSGASLTERSFAVPSDWTIGGAKTLSIAFFGLADNTGTLYVKINNTKLTYPHGPANMAKDSWQAWNIDLSSMDVHNVTTLQIGVDGSSAAGMILIDDIKLHPEVSVVITPAAPSHNALVGAWSFDEGSGTVAADSSGNGFDGTIVEGAWEPGQVGSALVFNGVSSQVILPPAAWDTIQQQVTVSLWVYVDSSLTQNPVTFAAYQDPANDQSRVISAHLIWSDGNLYFDAGGDATNYDRVSKGAPAAVYGDAWIHWAFTKNAETGEMKVYRNGMIWLSGLDKARSMTGVTSFALGARPDAEFWKGSMDEFQLYNEELTQEEILWLAGMTAPSDKPF